MDEDRAGKVQASSQQFAVNMENVAVQAISYYFDLLLAMINVDIDRQNLKIRKN